MPDSVYAAVAYLRIVDVKDSVTISLELVKARVARIERLAIPQLKHCGVMLLARLFSHVVNILKIPTGNIYTLTDSLVFLKWLRRNPQ